MGVDAPKTMNPKGTREKAPECMGTGDEGCKGTQGVPSYRLVRRFR